MPDQLVEESAQLRIDLAQSNRRLDAARRAIVELTHKYTKVTSERDKLRKAIGEPVPCDKCPQLCTWECRCHRCGRETKKEEKFYACDEHKDIITESHVRIRGRPPIWATKIAV